MRRRLIIISAGVLLFLGAVLLTSSPWDGDITEQAADPLAAAAGAEPSDVLPWHIGGDLLLFLFLTGGAAAGFAGGYYWRKLFSEARHGVNEARRGDEGR